jgi:hypothetical protein
VGVEVCCDDRVSEDGPPPRLASLADPPRKGEGKDGESCAPSRVDFRALCAAEKSSRRSHELSAGGRNPVLGSASFTPSPGNRPLRAVGFCCGVSPVCDPTPAVPFAMPGLSSFSRCGAIGASDSRAALARVGRAGSLPFRESGDFAMRRIWAAECGEGRAAAPVFASHASAHL